MNESELIWTDFRELNLSTELHIIIIRLADYSKELAVSTKETKCLASGIKINFIKIKHGSYLTDLIDSNDQTILCHTTNTIIINQIHLEQIF